MECGASRAATDQGCAGDPPHDRALARTGAQSVGLALPERDPLIETTGRAIHHAKRRTNFGGDPLIGAAPDGVAPGSWRANKSQAHARIPDIRKRTSMVE